MRSAALSVFYPLVTIGATVVLALLAASGLLLYLLLPPFFYPQTQLVMIGATGPKVSCRIRSMSWFTSTTTVGS